MSCSIFKSCILIPIVMSITTILIFYFASLFNNNDLEINKLILYIFISGFCLVIDVYVVLLLYYYLVESIYEVFEERNLMIVEQESIKII